MFRIGSKVQVKINSQILIGEITSFTPSGAYIKINSGPPQWFKDPEYELLKW